MTDDEVEFLEQSNFIEGEDDDIAQAAAAWQFMKIQQKLTNGAICRAHKILMLDKDYPPPRGYYRSIRKANVTIGGRPGADWSMVDGLMDNWILDYQSLGWKQAHIRFEHIHPFVDGNGRIGRILMNWQRLQEGLPLLIIHVGPEQQEYYKWFAAAA